MIHIELDDGSRFYVEMGASQTANELLDLVNAKHNGAGNLTLVFNGDDLCR